MQQVAAGLPGMAQQDTPLARAQAVMYQAFKEPEEQRRLQLAREALEICPDCADAYVVLAELARSRREALRWYEQGVAAGERALGPDFQKNVGRFWSVLETRPYLRARLGLAHALWATGRRDQAVTHLQEMLRLNPVDNQGVRYTLAGFLLFLDRDEELAHLLEQHQEDSATWAYTRALLAFRKHGVTPETGKLLKVAIKTNKHVPAYLLGDKFPPARQPSYYTPGDENEALNYIGGFLAAWRSTPGANALVRSRLKKRREEAPAAKGPLDLIKKWLNKNLTQKHDVWQADFCQMPSWIKIAGEMVRPWTILVTSRSNDLALAHQMSEAAPTAAQVWDALLQAMQHPAAGEPHRPTELQVRPEERWETLKPHLDEIGVSLVTNTELDQLEELFRDMTEHVCGKPRPGLLDMPGVTATQVGSFYAAAAFFFRQAPWKKVGYESVIKIECDKLQSGPRYAVVMGQSGLMTGLALYEDLAALRHLWTKNGSDEARPFVATTVTFGEEWTIPVADLEAARLHGWEIARPDAYPEVFHKEHGLTLRPPLAWELELVEGCLRTIPEFVNRHPQDEPGKEQFASGELKLVLSWVSEEDLVPQVGSTVAR